jgi:hypothetical protein
VFGNIANPMIAAKAAVRPMLAMNWSALGANRMTPIAAKVWPSAVRPLGDDPEQLDGTDGDESTAWTKHERAAGSILDR